MRDHPQPPTPDPEPLSMIEKLCATSRGELTDKCQLLAQNKNDYFFYEAVETNE